MKVTKFSKTPVTYDFYKAYQTQFFDKFELNQDLLKDLYLKKEKRDFLLWFK